MGHGANPSDWVERSRVQPGSSVSIQLLLQSPDLGMALLYVSHSLHHKSFNPFESLIISRAIAIDVPPRMDLFNLLM